MWELEYRRVETVRSDSPFLRSMGIAPCLIDRPPPLPYFGRPHIRLTDADAKWLKACGVGWEPEPAFQLPLDFCQDQESVPGDYPLEEVRMKMECSTSAALSRVDLHRADAGIAEMAGTLAQLALPCAMTTDNLELKAGGFATYAAFSAADIQAPHVRQPKTWIYVRQDFPPRFESLVQAKMVDSGENVVVLIPDDDGVFYPDEGDGYVGGHRMSCTNSVRT
jgi:hypothetical protein